MLIQINNKSNCCNENDLGDIHINTNQIAYISENKKSKEKRYYVHMSTKETFYIDEKDYSNLINIRSDIQ